MAEESQPPRYVKLIRDQEAPAEDICPGELNQPIHVPQPGCRKCAECGQVLPESYQLPADEPWSTGIFGCTADPGSYQDSSTLGGYFRKRAYPTGYFPDAYTVELDCSVHVCCSGAMLRLLKRIPHGQHLVSAMPSSWKEGSHLRF